MMRELTRHPALEFHRQGYGMVAAGKDKDPGWPLCFPRAKNGRIKTGNCTCRRSQKGQSCSHFSELVKLVEQIEKQNGGRSLGELFAESRWYRIGMLLTEGDSIQSNRVHVSQSGKAYIFTSTDDRLLARLHDESETSLRFIERAGLLPGKHHNRGQLFQRLSSILSSPEEKQLNKAGMLTNRQATEQGFWGRLSYHFFQEYGDDGFVFRPAIDKQSGDFVLSCSGKDAPLLELIVPRIKVRKLLKMLHSEFPDEPLLKIHPVPLKSIFRVTSKTKLDLEVRPMIQALQASGEAGFFESKDFARFRYGDLVYIKDMNILAELEHPDSTRRFAAPVAMQLKKSQFPSFLDEHQEEIKSGGMVLDAPFRKLSIFREFDRVEISLDALRRSWYWLSISYGIGSEKISLADVLEARQKGKKYLKTRCGWIDVNCEAFRILETIGNQSEEAVQGDRLRFSAVDLLRLLSSLPEKVEVRGEQGRDRILQRLLALKPAKPWKRPKGLKTELRPYQQKGVDWLRFLYENGLGGLLCDDMGLGKTHQAMALMVWLREKHQVKGPFLVVSPTTVISHWRNKIRDHAPGLDAVVYHGGNRSLSDAVQEGDVLLTSYNIMRNDILALKEIEFPLVLFDEAQNLKNRETQSYQAAALLKAGVRVGLTGTPMENSLIDIKSLFDLVLPGYLGSDEEYAARYADGSLSADFHILKRTISPFTLRRLKKDVLTELPEKIDDLRTCALSDMQVRLYREALSKKGNELLSQLRSDSKQLPYIHIFALLNLLKQICDHPALVLNRIGAYEKYQSGKWELFQELLFETLDSGQKIVVFTQYLGMIAMMEKLLGSLGIGFASLTGASRNRGEIVRRFNEDPECRVFLGSLKAGGTGIDLVAASTVLHYDRWWNAAREDQATDRVHRIGQKRSVQVIKLVTEGTLEEKIAAIIEKKRRLMNSVVQVDSPQLNKIFTREELIELLSPV